MKRIGYILMCVLSVLSVSCFDDDSNTDIRELNPIVIDLDNTDLYVNQMDTLRVEPLIYCEGVPDTQLSFEWVLMKHGTIVPQLLDTTMYFCAQITTPPDNYQLRLTVTDKTTGIYRIETYSVFVNPTFADGLLIADTKDDGVTSDINLVMCRELSANFHMYNEERKIFRGIWEMVNHTPLEGNVLSVNLSSLYNENKCATIVTSKNAYRADYTDYKYLAMGSSLFYVPPLFLEEGIHSAMATFRSNAGMENLAVNGLVYGRTVGGSYGTELYPTGVDEYNITMMMMPTTLWTMAPSYAYDALGKRMLFFTQEAAYKPAEFQYGGGFNAGDLSDYEALFLGESSEGILLLADNLKTGTKEALVMNEINQFQIQNASNIAQKKVPVSNDAPHIEQARFWASSKRGTALYYATETEVYAGSISDMGRATLQWKVNERAGETITGLQVYNWQGGYFYSDETDDFVSSDYRLLLITVQTANGEGKVTAVPIKNVHTGVLEQSEKRHIVLDGFGKILGIYKQVR